MFVVAPEGDGTLADDDRKKKQALTDGHRPAEAGQKPSKEQRDAETGRLSGFAAKARSVVNDAMVVQQSAPTDSADQKDAEGTSTPRPVSNFKPSTWPVMNKVMLVGLAVVAAYWLAEAVA
jgi:hypothetical protein